MKNEIAGIFLAAITITLYLFAFVKIFSGEDK